jgi:hypothetical protein
MIRVKPIREFSLVDGHSILLINQRHEMLTEAEYISLQERHLFRVFVRKDKRIMWNDLGIECHGTERVYELIKILIQKIKDA